MSFTVNPGVVERSLSVSGWALRLRAVWAAFLLAPVLLGVLRADLFVLLFFMAISAHPRFFAIPV
jgi:hypothetical protein